MGAQYSWNRLSKAAIRLSSDELWLLRSFMECKTLSCGRDSSIGLVDLPTTIIPLDKEMRQISLAFYGLVFSWLALSHRIASMMPTTKKSKPNASPLTLPRKLLTTSHWVPKR